MSDIDALIAEYRATRKTYAQLMAAKQAVEKKFQAAARLHEQACRALHQHIGPLAPKTLTTNIERSRYYEIEHVAEARYGVRAIQRHTGKPGKAVWQNRSRAVGSLLPMTDDNDPVYAKWKRLKIVEALEGKAEHETIF